MAWLKVVALLLWCHMTQRPFRTGLTIVGVALGVAASVAVRTANVEVLHSFEQAVLIVAGPTTLEVSGGDFGLDEQLIAKAIWECLKENDPDGVIEILEAHLKVKNKSQLAKEHDLPRTTLYHAFKSKNPTLHTLAKLVHATA